MSQLLLFALLGIGSGALIAGIAISIVLTYRGAGAINLAAGATAMLGAYVFYGLQTGGYLFFSWLSLGSPVALVPALLISLAVCAVFGLLVDVLIYRPLRLAPPLAKLVASLGVFIGLQAIIILRFGGNGQSAPNVIGGGVVHLFNGVVPDNRFILAAIVAIVAGVLAAVYRYTRFGLATRAAQESEGEAALAGMSANELSAINTMLGAVVAGGLGILAAPLTQLDPTTLALAVVPALGAALLASFTSFGIAAAAGVGMGVIESLLVYLQTKPWFPTSGGQPIPGVADLIFFVIIAGTLMWRGNSLPVRGALAEPRLPAAPSPTRIMRPTVVLSVVVIICFLVFPYDFRQALINTILGATVCLSLVLVTGLVGQVSFAQYALGGVAGLVTAHLAEHLGLGFPIGPLAGVVVAVAFGLLAALPALRVRGVNLALITLAAAVAIENFGFDNPSWGGGANGTPVPEPHFLGLNIGSTAHFPVNASTLPSPVFGFVCLAVFVAIALLVAALRRTAYGHQMLAVRSSERAAAAVGISPRRIKLLAFALSGAIAGVAGVMYGYNFSSVDPTQFGIVNGLAVVAFAYLGGITTIRGAIIAGMLTTEGVMSHILEKWVGVPINYQLLVGGVALVFTVVMNPGGIALAPPPQWPRRVVDRLRHQATTSGASTASAPAAVAVPPRQVKR